jgi:hypothetical protein
MKDLVSVLRLVDHRRWAATISKLGRPLIRGGAPRALLDALGEPRLGLVMEGTADTSRSDEPGHVRVGGRPNAAAG